MEVIQLKQLTKTLIASLLCTLVFVSSVNADTVLKMNKSYKSKYTLSSEEELLIADMQHTRIKYLELAAQSDIRKQMREILEQQVGKPYVWGANGPMMFDCSGLVNYVYKHVGKSINCKRCTTWDYPSHTYIIPKEDLKTGDIILSHGHVMVFIEGDKVIHAKNPKYGVIWDSLEEAIKTQKNVEYRRFRSMQDE